MADPADMSEQYNTPLTDDERKAYDQWLAALTQKQGRDVSADVRDYDLQGFFKSGESQADNGHGPDTFKKPSHPTFSTESKYHGADGYEGGQWIDLGDGKWSYKPSKTNLKFYGPKSLREYFNRVEPDVHLDIEGPA